MKTAWKWNCFLLVALSLANGCAKFDLRKNIPWGEGKDGKIEQPLRVEVVWVDTVLTKPDQKPMRGFGGRLYFFGPNNSQESVKVDGTLVIYGFDETNRDHSNVTPDRKIVYPAKEFASLYSTSKLGHSYSVWVPWDEAGGLETHISLIARFTPTKGAVVTSDQMKVLLPGFKPQIDVRAVNHQQSPDPRQAPAANMAVDNGADGVQQASFEQPVSNADISAQAAADPQKHGRELSSFTIPLRGSQTSYFLQRPAYGGATSQGVASLPEVKDGAYPVPNALPVLPTNSLPTNSLPTQAVPAAPPSQTMHSTTQASTQPPRSGRFEPVRPPARATLAAPPQFSRARLEPHPAIQQFVLASSQSPVTSQTRPGSSPAAGPPYSPAAG